MVLLNVHLAVHRDGLEMGSVIVCATWHHVALMVVTAVGQGMARAKCFLVSIFVVTRRHRLASVRVRQATALNVGLVSLECL